LLAAIFASNRCACRSPLRASAAVCAVVSAASLAAAARAAELIDTVSVEAFGGAATSVLFLSATDADAVAGFDIGAAAAAEVALLTLEVLMILPRYQGKITLHSLTARAIQT